MTDLAALKTTILLLVSDPLSVVMRETLEHADYVVIATGDLGEAVDRLQDVTPDLSDHPHLRGGSSGPRRRQVSAHQMSQDEGADGGRPR